MFVSALPLDQNRKTQVAGAYLLLRGFILPYFISGKWGRGRLALNLLKPPHLKNNNMNCNGLKLVNDV